MDFSSESLDRVVTMVGDALLIGGALLSMKNIFSEKQQAAAASADVASSSSVAPAAPAEVKDDIPIVRGDLSLIYPSSKQAMKRYGALTSKFLDSYGFAPSFFVRAPGRVNLIGEHIDYCGYAVLPMAIGKDTVIAVGVSDADNETELRFANVEDSIYPAKTITYDSSSDCPLDKNDHHWTNYVLCGYKGVLEMLNKDKKVAKKNLSLAFHGTVPQGSGLSSSSALVVSSALATLYAHDLQSTRSQMASLTAQAERFIGVESGGMDQAISMCGELGKAKLIEFNPVRAHDVILPPGASFVISNTLVTSNKYVTAAGNYNVRVSECRFAAAMLAKALGIFDKAVYAPVQTLGNVQQSAGKSLPEMAALVSKILHKQPYSLSEVAAVLEMPESECKERFMRSSSGGLVELNGNVFECHNRAKHVYEEADRVLQFRKVAASSQKDVLSELGRLMNESHYSNRDLYCVSCPELEALTTISRAAGALGSRLTGAGWGGCTVSLVEDSKVEAFINEVKQRYYIDQLGLIGEEGIGGQLDTYIFSSKPGSGASIFLPK